jgi:hypothetical protein
MKNRINLSLLVLVFSTTIVSSQSYVGHGVDNYAGIHGVVYNPANVVSSNVRADINLFSASVFAGSDYLNINFDDITNPEDGYDFEDDAETFPKNNNNFFLNADVLGPSFMFNLSKKSSIGLISRFRAFSNINGINGELFETVSNDFEDNEDFDFNSTNLNITTHAWGEIGLAYGRILLDRPNHMLSGGVTLKYLMGAGGLFVSTPGLQGTYTDSTEMLDSQGTLNYGSSQGFDEDEISFSEIAAGYGLDIGFVYEWHPKREEGTRFHQDPYKLKIGVSVTDIGSISYDDSEVKSYDLNANVSTASYDSDVEEFLDENYTNTLNVQSATIQLPTAMHLLLDYRLAKKWLISAQADFSLVNSGELQSNQVINTYTLMPRFESKWFTFFAPLSIREYDGFVFGGGIRLGPLSIGSGSVFSNLLSDESRTTDVFVGLKIPIYR